MEKTFNFIKASDRLPEESGKYLCIALHGGYTTLPYSARHKAFNAGDDEETPRSAFNVDYWAEIPEGMRR